MSPYRDFFLHHSKLDIDRVAGAGNMDEFMTALKGNEFYAPLQSVYENGNGLLFDYGMALDLYYFNQIWSVRKSYSRETIWTRSPRLMVRSLIC